MFGTSLLSTLGEQHRKQRKMLNPVFSPKHMRDLAPIFYPIAHQLRNILAQKVKEGEEDIDMSTWMSRAALEYIGQGGMGYQFDALDLKKTNKYHDAVKLFVYFLHFLEICRLVLTAYIPDPYYSSSTLYGSSSHTWSGWEALGSAESFSRFCPPKMCRAWWTLSTSCMSSLSRSTKRRRTC